MQDLSLSKACAPFFYEINNLTCDIYLSRVLYRVARPFERGESIGKRGEREETGGQRVVSKRSELRGPLRPSLGVDATLPAPRIAPVRVHTDRNATNVHVQVQTHIYTYIHVRESGRPSPRLASIPPPFSGLSRTSCGTSPSTSASSRDVSVRTGARSRMYMATRVTECLESPPVYSAYKMYISFCPLFLNFLMSRVAPLHFT